MDNNFVFDKMCADYHKACEEFGLKRSELGFFVFRLAWEGAFGSLETGDVSSVYDIIKNSFAVDMNNPEIVKQNERLLKQKKEFEEMEEFDFSERVSDFDEESDDYDMQFGPTRKRRR